MIAKILTLQEDTDSRRGVLPSRLPKTGESDADLRAVVEAWRSLSDAMKRQFSRWATRPTPRPEWQVLAGEMLMRHSPWNWEPALTRQVFRG